MCDMCRTQVVCTPAAVSTPAAPSSPHAVVRYLIHPSSGPHRNPSPLGNYQCQATPHREPKAAPSFIQSKNIPFWDRAVPGIHDSQLARAAACVHQACHMYCACPMHSVMHMPERMLPAVANMHSTNHTIFYAIGSQNLTKPQTQHCTRRPEPAPSLHVQCLSCHCRKASFTRDACHAKGHDHCCQIAQTKSPVLHTTRVTPTVMCNERVSHPSVAVTA